MRDNPNQDSDNIIDGWELLNRLDPTFTADGLEDPDSDDLVNELEFANNGDPHVIDTDFDGLEDGEEVALGRVLTDRDLGLSLSAE